MSFSQQKYELELSEHQTETKLSVRLANETFDLAQLVNKLKRNFDKDTFDDAKRRSKSAMEMLKQLTNSNEEFVVKRKLTNDLNSVLDQLQAVTIPQPQSRIMKPTRVSNYTQNADERRDREDAPLLSLQEDPAFTEQIEMNESVIAEREQQLLGLETSIAEVNEIFRDLGTLVNEQQYLLGTIVG
jgi:syntaxin 7